MSLASKNLFAVLDSGVKPKEKKKSSSKTEKREKEAKKAVDAEELEKQLFSQAVALSSWADDEDDDFTPVAEAGWTQVGGVAVRRQGAGIRIDLKRRV
jgi:hypothetical protein